MGNPEYVLLHLFNQLNTPVPIQSILAGLTRHTDYPSLLSVSDILHEFGIDHVAAHIPVSELVDLPTPFVVHLFTNNGEFAIVNYIDETHLEISNEWWNRKTMSFDDLKGSYSGTALIFKAPQDIRSGIYKKKDLVKKTDLTSDGSREHAKALPWKVTFMDIGASYGLADKWETYANDVLFDLTMVEPDEAERNKLKLKYPHARIIPFALGDQNKEMFMHLTTAQSCSSVLEPDVKVLGRFPVKKSFEVVRKVPVMVYKLEDLVIELNIDHPKFVKIDVQGFEFEVLKGFGRILDSVLCIELEAHFIPIYKNEKTLTDINAYLTSRGFYLRHLETIGNFEGEVVEFNAYFIKQETIPRSIQEREMIGFWEKLNDIPEAKRCLK